MMRGILVVGFICLMVVSAYGANYPCSGKKGGVSHCQGATFICNDGSTSASKRNCAAEKGGSQSPDFTGNTTSSEMEQATSNDCSCRSGRYCTGPRGGKFCYSDSGRKNYLRRN